MMLVYLLCLVFLIAMAAFVLFPLVSESGQRADVSPARQGFADEEELRSIIALREDLIRKLVHGKAHEASVESLTQEDAWDTLTGITLRLKKAGLRYLFESDRQILPLILSLLVGALLFAGSLGALPAQAQGVPEIPPVTRTEDGAAWSAVHQFVVSPEMGSARVIYKGMFNSAQDEELVLLLPLPEGFQDLRFEDNSLVMSPSQKGIPAVKFKAKVGLNVLTSDFHIPMVSRSRAQFANAKAPALPGLILVQMSWYDGALRRLGDGLGLDIWPARLTGFDGGWRKDTQENSVDPQMDPLLSKEDPQFIFTAVKRNGPTDPFPSFEVNGIVPQRMPLYVLAGLLAAVLLGGLLWSATRSGTKATVASA